jgi:hypothetical protein
VKKFGLKISIPSGLCSGGKFSIPMHKFESFDSLGEIWNSDLSMDCNTAIDLKNNHSMPFHSVAREDHIFIHTYTLKASSALQHISAQYWDHWLAK